MGYQSKVFMKNVCIVLCILMAQGLALPAQEAAAKATHSLSLGVSTGLLAGASEEIIYRNASTPSKLSQLLWEMKPLAYAGLDLRYDLRRAAAAYFAGASVKLGIPGETGLMEDRDWIVSDYPSFLTHYSVHDNKTENAVLIDASIGTAFQLFQRFLFKLYASYSFMYFSWAGTGGSFLYPADPNQPNQTHVYLVDQITVITYTQAWHSIAPAIAFYGAFNRYFAIEVQLKLSPFVWASSEDHHLLRSLVITEELDGGFFIEPALTLSFKAAPAFTVSLSVLYRQISGTRGDSTYAGGDDFPEPNTFKGLAGASYAAFDVGLAVQYNLF
jgi:outer membrane protease